MSRWKIIGALAVLGVLLGACLPVIPLQVGQTVTYNCPTGYAAFQEQAPDSEQVDVQCRKGEDLKQQSYTCPDGVVSGQVVDLNSVDVKCEVIVLDFDETAEPDPATYEAVLATQQSTNTFTTASAGDGCWRARPSAASYSGWSLNWRITTTVEWCVVGGLVRCGVFLADSVREGRMYEIGSGWQFWITPCNRSTRLINADWDLRYGWCPWCVNIDVDLEMTIGRYGRYYGKYRWNGEGI